MTLPATLHFKGTVCKFHRLLKKKKGHLFITKTKALLDAAMNEGGVMEFVVFTSTADIHIQIHIISFHSN